MAYGCQTVQQILMLMCQIVENETTNWTFAFECELCSILQVQFGRAYTVEPQCHGFHSILVLTLGLRLVES